jgi:hypothetical protein
MDFGIQLMNLKKLRKYVVPMNGARITILGREETEDGASCGI